MIATDEYKGGTFQMRGGHAAGLPPRWPRRHHRGHDLAVRRPPAPEPVLEPEEFSWVRVCPGSMQRGLADRKENGTAKHAEHATGGSALQGQDDAFDLKARLAEVE